MFLSGCTIVSHDRVKKKNWPGLSESTPHRFNPTIEPKFRDNMPNLYNERNYLKKFPSVYELNQRMVIAGEYVIYHQDDDMRYLICLKDSVRYITNNDYKYRKVLSRVLPKNLKVKSGDTFRYLAKAQFHLYNRQSTDVIWKSDGQRSELIDYLNDVHTPEDSMRLRNKLQSGTLTLGDTIYNSIYRSGKRSVLIGDYEIFTAYQIAYENDSIWILDQDIDDYYKHDLYTIHNKDIVIENDTNDRAWKRALKHLKKHTSFVHTDVLQMNDTVIMIQHYPSSFYKKYHCASESSIITERITTRNNGKKINTVKVTFLGDNFNKLFIEISHKYIKYNILENKYEDLRNNHLKHESDKQKWY